MSEADMEDYSHGLYKIFWPRAPDIDYPRSEVELKVHSVCGIGHAQK